MNGICAVDFVAKPQNGSRKSNEKIGFLLTKSVQSSTIPHLLRRTSEALSVPNLVDTHTLAKSNAIIPCMMCAHKAKRD